MAKLIDSSDFLDEDIFKIEGDKAKGFRSRIPAHLRAELISSIIKLINHFKTKYKAYSYYHLREIFNKTSYQKELKSQLLKLIDGRNKYCDTQYISFLFNIIFESQDSLI